MAADGKIKTTKNSELSKEMDEMSKELELMKETLTQYDLRCHLLEIDLATQLGPDMQLAIKDCRKNCQQCNDVVKVQETLTTATESRGDGQP